MIVFDLCCAQGHVFEGWFGSTGDFASQKDRGLLSCPQCGDSEVIKAPMAPSVPKKGNQQQPGKAEQQDGPDSSGVPMSSGTLTPEVQQAMQKLAEVQAKALKDSKWVGKSFAEDARAMHYGERDAEAIHGEASLDDAKLLIEEGIQVAPLPFPVTPPEDLN